MNRYVNADMLIKKYIDTDIEKFNNSDVKIVLENLKQNILKAPSINIVLCKECKYKSMCSQSMSYTTRDAHSVTIESKSVDFCPYGEREDE